MMARAFPELIPCVSTGIGSSVRTLVCHDSRHVWTGWSADFYCSILPWEGAWMLEGPAAQAALLYMSTDLTVSRGVLIGYYAYCTVPDVLFSNLEDKARKRGDLMGARSPFTFPMSVGLGGSMSVALNALASVPVTGGGGALLRLRPTDSLDTLSLTDGCGLSSL